MQVSRLAEQNAALQEEVRQLRAQKGPGSDNVATLHAVNAQLAEENAILSSSCEDLERRLAGEGGSSSGSNGPTRGEVRASPLRSHHCGYPSGKPMPKGPQENMRGARSMHTSGMPKNCCSQGPDILK